MARTAQDRSIDRELIAWAQGTDPKRAAWARRRLVARHAGLVYSASRRYWATHLTGEDIYQEGVIGLLEGIKRFDLKRKVQFSSFALPWIRCYVLRAICPVKHSDGATYWKISKARREARTEQPLTAEQLVAATGHALGRVEKVLASIRTKSSLDKILFESEGQNVTLSDAMVDANAVNAESALVKGSTAAALRRAMKSLEPRARRVLERHFGFDVGDSEDGETLQEIGDSLDLSRERIRQIQAAAIKKLAVLLEEEAA